MDPQYNPWEGLVGISDGIELDTNANIRQKCAPLLSQGQKIQIILDTLKNPYKEKFLFLMQFDKCMTRFHISFWDPLNSSDILIMNELKWESYIDQELYYFKDEYSEYLSKLRIDKADALSTQII